MNMSGDDSIPSSVTMDAARWCLVVKALRRDGSVELAVNVGARPE